MIAETSLEHQYADTQPLTWETLTPDEQRDCLLSIKDIEVWLEPQWLQTLALYRKIPLEWARFKARYRKYGGDPRELERVVDHAHPRAKRSMKRTSAREVLTTDYGTLTYVIEGILPAGATLLVGKSKDGKSLMAYNLAMAVASGGTALGSYDVAAGSVWYLALEDGGRRAQERLNDLQVQMGPLPDAAQDRLIFTFEDAARLGEGLEEEILDWIASTPDARLLIIDILEKVRPRRKRNSVYEDDYAATEPLARLAQQHNVAVLIVHHSNKSNPEDFRNAVSGSDSLLGGADNLWQLHRQPLSEEATLNITGRDIKEAQSLAMQFRDGFWTVLGETALVRMSSARQQILEILQGSKEPMTPTTIAKLAGKNVNTTKILLMKMVQTKTVFQPWEGHYAIPPLMRTTPVNPINPVTAIDPITSINVYGSEAPSLQTVYGEEVSCKPSQPPESQAVIGKNGHAVYRVYGVKNDEPCIHEHVRDDNVCDDCGEGMTLS